MKAVLTLNSYLRTVTLAPNLTHIPNPTLISIEIFTFGIIQMNQIFIMSIPNVKYMQLVVFWEILLLLPNAFHYIAFNRYTSSVLPVYYYEKNSAVGIQGDLCDDLIWHRRESIHTSAYIKLNTYLVVNFNWKLSIIILSKRRDCLMKSAAA